MREDERGDESLTSVVGDCKEGELISTLQICSGAMLPPRSPCWSVLIKLNSTTSSSFAAELGQIAATS